MEETMCLGVPGLVVEVDELTALVDFWGVRRRIRLDLADEPVHAGDYVLNHVGFAIRRIPPEDVQTTLELYEQLLKENTGTDLMTADVRSEIEAGRAGEERLRPERARRRERERVGVGPREHRK
jgi:hydrogenase expression/formation protein HypC